MWGEQEEQEELLPGFLTFEKSRGTISMREEFPPCVQYYFPAFKGSPKNKISVPYQIYFGSTQELVSVPTTWEREGTDILLIGKA
ncbi:hypothetical protein CEN46_23620 [Fischerella thermalis CCMEE 5318]|uniref:Uncharacterized protein n=1 Tax=Fischerella thermalis CCMEE 5318 TaxID=2019666 RepID=A0A2N6L688_9CYAN|nr:hypothetical protein CEN46_23620 [Fischerella thermalis CCMEE 5318]